MRFNTLSRSSRLYIEMLTLATGRPPQSWCRFCWFT